MIDQDVQLIWEAYICEGASYSDEEDNDWPITIVTMDNYHKYTTVDGIRYELYGDDAREIIVPIESVETTEGNSFYPEHIERYKEYIKNGGILQTFPVQEIKPNYMSLDEMIDELENSVVGDIYSAPYWVFQDEYNINHEELDRLIEEYRDLNDDDEVSEELDTFKNNVREFFNDHMGDNTTYHLQDSNHRFEALKSLGVKNVMIHILN